MIVSSFAVASGGKKRTEKVCVRSIGSILQEEKKKKKKKKKRLGSIMEKI
jgi:hypothetical protein